MHARFRFGLAFSLMLAFMTMILVRCSTAPALAVHDDDSFVVYSLDGDTSPTRAPGWREVGFHGWQILRQCSLDPSKGLDLLEQMIDVAVDAPSLQIDCFNPRHGLRVERESGSVDYLICFECRTYEVWTDGVVSFGAITTEPESAFATTLKNCRSEENVRS
jgi:hypothetical protein